MTRQRLYGFLLRYTEGGKPWERYVASRTKTPLRALRGQLGTGAADHALTPLPAKLAPVRDAAKGMGPEARLALSPALIAATKDAELAGDFTSQTIDMAPLDGTTDETFPPALKDHLFTEGTGTYALLDGALIMGLKERLAASDLPHACLYGGSAAEDFADTAPYIVQLTPEAGLTKSLFSVFAKDGIQRGLWADEAGIILRSPASLEALRRHLRKFTYLEEEGGKRVFFRFYVPVTLRTLIAHMDPESLAQFGQGTQMFLCPAKPAGAFVLSRG